MKPYSVGWSRWLSKWYVTLENEAAHSFYQSHEEAYGIAKDLNKIIKKLTLKTVKKG